MIIKEGDSRELQINQLEKLIALATSEEQRKMISRELKMLRSGSKGEKDSAYFIDFKYKSSRKWAVIHDLRIELEGSVAQMDHLIINRWFDIYVLESKHYAAGIQITREGEFLVFHRGSYRPIESPIEQNERHVFLLKRAIEHHEIMPTKMGIRIAPKYKSYVLISPESKVLRPPKSQFDTGNVIKSDLLLDRILKELDNISLAPVLAKMCTSETLMEVATKLARLHRPAQFDYEKKFGIKRPQTDRPSDNNGQRPLGHDLQHSCFACGKVVTSKVVQYCQEKWAVFGGKIYCFNCQKLAQKRPTPSITL
jgi:hypothetical protein